MPNFCFSLDLVKALRHCVGMEDLLMTIKFGLWLLYAYKKIDYRELQESIEVFVEFFGEPC